MISNIFCINLNNKFGYKEENSNFSLDLEGGSQKMKSKKRNFEEFFEENIVEKQTIPDDRYLKDKEEIERIIKKSDILNNPLILAESYKTFLIERERYSNDSQNPFELNHWIYEQKHERKILEDIFFMLFSQENDTFELVNSEKYEFKINQLKVKCEVSHLSPLSLTNILEEFIKIANSLQEIDFLTKELHILITGKVFESFIREINQIKEGFLKFICNLHLIFLFQSNKCILF